MKITEKRDGQVWMVESDSGNTYTVRYLGVDEDEHELRKWSCDCPAGTHRRECKHQRAVRDLVDGNNPDRDIMGDIFGC